jgi:aminoglycoside phosphotransferase (APT) family kinase protein
VTDTSTNPLPWRREVSAIIDDLTRWVAHAFGPEARLGECTLPDNGMANETLLFAVDGERYVARLAPHRHTPFPVFPTFDLAFQRDCIELVRARTQVPVPEIVRYEEDPTWLGTPFLVMLHVDGNVPRDSPPYLLEGFMTELSTADLAELETSSIDVLVGIHQVREPGDLELFSHRPDPTPPLDRLVAEQRRYYDWAREGRRVPAIEEALEALEGSVPDNRRTVLLWGDSRIGNIIYRDARPVAVLDWEMATTGPPEVDVAWMVFLQTFMREMITTFLPDVFASEGPAALAGLFDRNRVVDRYQARSGEPLDDLTWYEAFAGVRFAIILMRMSLRAAAFGALPAAEDPDDMVMFAPLLRRLVADLGR